MADPYIANVVLLAHLDIAPPVDATGRHTFTVNGGATIQSTNAKFGSAMDSPGTTGSHISTPIDSDFAFTSEPFTVECWARVEGSSQQNILGVGPLNSEIVSIIYNGTTLGFRGGAYLPNGNFIGGTSFVTTRNAWVHLAVERPMGGAGSVYFYVNGTRFSGVTTDANALRTPSGNLMIGGWDPSIFLDGQVDEVRITKGVARYGGASSITVPTAPFDDPVTVSARPVVIVMT